jgi:formylglycine-generating enzyme required for sulfatase activity
MKKSFILYTFMVGVLSSFILGNKSVKLPNKALSNLCEFIPSGDVKIGDQFKTVQSFIMFNAEVTNSQYQEFLKELKDEGQIDKLNIAQIDTLNWNTNQGENGTLVKYYHTHPAYQNSPVVNISYESALLYCEWLTKKMQQAELISKEQRFRLPTKEEFIRAARGDNHNQVYSWANAALQDNKGLAKCNFLNVNAENIHFNTMTNQFELKEINANHKLKSFTTSVKSFSPNHFGLYNLNGNVSEMIAEKGVALGGNYSSPGYDVRNESEITFTGVSTKIGFRPVLTFLPK